MAIDTYDYALTALFRIFIDTNSHKLYVDKIQYEEFNSNYEILVLWLLVPVPCWGEPPHTPWAAACDCDAQDRGVGLPLVQ